MSAKQSVIDHPGMTMRYHTADNRHRRAPMTGHRLVDSSTTTIGRS